jgi:rubrerythrin
METRWDDPEDQIARYLQTFADGYVFDLNEDPKAFVADDSTVGEVLIHAIDKERDSILFYVGMKEMVPESLGKAQINAIIREEMTHVTLLNDCLKAVDGD